MIRVRFPNGQCITYNTGYYVETIGNNTGRSIRTEKGGALLAWVPNDCIIEWVAPCAVENPLEARVLARATDYVESLSGSTPGQDDSYLIRLKRKLAGYNITRRRFVR